MRHLGSAALLDLAEGRLTASDVPHLAVCDRCRGDVAQLEAALHAASMVAVPEPSPLFWEHLSARVHAAVVAEPHAPSSRWRMWPIPGRFAIVAALTVAGAVAVALVVAPTRPGRTLRGSVVERTTQTTVSMRDAADPADDASITLLGDLVGTVDWDHGPVGLDLNTGPLDRGLADLTADLTDEQRGEVRRVLTEEMKSHGT